MTDKVEVDRQDLLILIQMVQRERFQFVVLDKKYVLQNYEFADLMKTKYLWEGK